MSNVLGLHRAQVGLSNLLHAMQGTFRLTSPCTTQGFLEPGQTALSCLVCPMANWAGGFASQAELFPAASRSSATQMLSDEPGRDDIIVQLPAPLLKMLQTPAVDKPISTESEDRCTALKVQRKQYQIKIKISRIQVITSETFNSHPHQTVLTLISTTFQR